MRIVSYNILDGGEGRADPLAEVLVAQNADVVALIEADDLAVLDRIALRLQMDVVHAVGANGKSVALLSRWPIRDSANHAALHPAMTKAFVLATVVEPGGRAWKIGAVHLQHRVGEEYERTRDQELEVILKACAPLRDCHEPHILLGDFNANSPIQQIDLAKCKPSTREQTDANGGAIPRRVVEKLLATGYVDTYHAAHPDAATTNGTFTTQFPGQRVDYIFAHSLTGRIKSAWIEYDRLAKYASDHFPIGAEFE